MPRHIGRLAGRALAVFLLIASISAAASAQEKEEIPADVMDALEGFEEEKPSASSPTEDGSLDSVLEGFGDSMLEEPLEAKAGAVKKKSIFDLGGAVTLSSSWNFAHQAPEEGETDYRGLSRLRSELQLDLDIDLAEKWKAFVSGRVFYDAAYSINGRDYTKDVLRAYEKEGELRDTYIQGSLARSLDIKIGRQIVVWGRSDNIRVTDVLNPMDNREPGMVDIEDLRLPVFMTKLDYYFGDWGASAMAIHEMRFNKDPAYGSDFYPFGFKPPKEEIPASHPDNTEFALALNGIFTGWDISFYWARIYDDQPHIEKTGTALTQNGQPAPVLERKHSLLTMFGVAANVTAGNWLVKAEAAYFNGFEYFSLPGEKKSRLDILLGAEYSGFTETMIALEIVDRRTFDFEKALEQAPDSVREDDFQIAARYTGDFWRDTLHLTFVGSILGLHAEDGSFERFSVQYDVMDALSVTGGVMLYHDGDKLFFRDIEDNDRIFLDVKYSF